MNDFMFYIDQELIVPQNDIDIYDGEAIDGSIEAKSKNNWVQIFDMIDLTFNNLQQQNKELKRTVNELSSKVNKVSSEAGQRSSVFLIDPDSSNTDQRAKVSFNLLVNTRSLKIKSIKMYEDLL